ncbi:MAG: HEAT repeat domain-containing protein [bacterium]
MTETSETNEAAREAARLVVHRLGGAFRAVRLYSAGHGFTQRAIVNALAAVEAYCRERGPLKLIVLPEGIAFDFDPVPYEDEMAAEFVRALRGGLVLALHLLPGIDVAEVRTLFDVLRMPQPAVQKAGGAGVLLRQRGVQCIVIDELGREAADAPEAPAIVEEVAAPGPVEPAGPEESSDVEAPAEAAPPRIRRHVELPVVRLSDEERGAARADLTQASGATLTAHAVQRLLDVLPALDSQRFEDVLTMLEEQAVPLSEAAGSLDAVRSVVAALSDLSTTVADARAELSRASLHRIMGAAVRGPVLHALERSSPQGGDGGVRREPLPAGDPALALLRAAPDESVRLLLELVADEDRRQIRLEIVDLLPTLAAGRLDLLADHLVDPRWYIVRNVITVLARIGTPGVVPYFRAGIEHPDPRVRREAVQALGQLPAERAEAMLIEALSHSDSDTRALAARWLGLRHVPDAVTPLAAILEREPLGESVRLKHEVIRALGRIGTLPAQSALQRVAMSGGLLRGDEVEGLRQAAVAILGELRKQQGP